MPKNNKALDLCSRVLKKLKRNKSKKSHATARFLKKGYFIRTAGLVFVIIAALCSILLFGMLEEKKDIVDVPSEPNVPKDDVQSEPNEKTEYDPVANVTVNGSAKTESIELPEYNYSEELAKFEKSSALKTQGFKLDADSFDDTFKLALVEEAKGYEAEYSKKEYKVNVLVEKAGDLGGYAYSYREETADCPILRPYYGYIIYYTAGKKQLLNSSGKVLVYDLSGYEPAYSTTLSGEPLFVKKDKYYFYYDKTTDKSLFFDEITDKTFDTLPAIAPSAYSYFKYDYEIMENYYNMTKKDGVVDFTDMTFDTPDTSGMVEYITNENRMLNLKIPAYTYDSNAKLYPFYTHQYVKKINNQKQIDLDPTIKPTYDFTIEATYWGYMDKDGKVVIEPDHKMAYPFSEEGFAVVEDRHGHMCIINTKGTVIYNPYDPPLYIPSMGNKKIRDIYYMPDTFGIENTGMFTVDNGFTRMRRRLVDTENGYTIKRETEVVVSIEGRLFNYPADYDLVSYSDGMLLLEKDGLYGYMSCNGEWIIRPVLKYASPFSEGLAVIGYEAEHLGMIDNKGNTVMPFMYSYISDCSGGVVTAYSSQGGWTVYNKMSTQGVEKEQDNPILQLKRRALAEVKYNFYKTLEEQGDKQ